METIAHRVDAQELAPQDDVISFGSSKGIAARFTRNDTLHYESRAFGHVVGNGCYLVEVVAPEGELEAKSAEFNLILDQLRFDKRMAEPASLRVYSAIDSSATTEFEGVVHGTGYTQLETPYSDSLASDHWSALLRAEEVDLTVELDVSRSFAECTGRIIYVEREGRGVRCMVLPANFGGPQP